MLLSYTRRLNHITNLMGVTKVVQYYNKFTLPHPTTTQNPTRLTTVDTLFIN